MAIVSKRILGIPAKTDWPAPTLHGTRWTGADGNTYATIIGNPDGTPFTVAGVSLFVAVIDAKYRRPNLPWNLYNVSLPTLTNCWSYGSDVYLTAGMTEAEINGLSFILDENHSGAFNSDVLVANAGTIDVFGNTGSISVQDHRHNVVQDLDGIRAGKQFFFLRFVGYRQ